MNPLNFDMDALRTMAVGVELGGFSHAALRLNRSPSAVSMQLRKLETQAGQPLFKRNGRGLALTEAGEVLLQYARQVLALNDEMGLAVGAIKKGGTVRIGVPQDFTEFLLQGLLARYSREHPTTHVEVKSGRNHALANDVANGRLDMALAWAVAGNRGENTIATVPGAWIGRARNVDKLAREAIVPLICFDGPCLFRDMGIDALARAGRPWRLAMTTPSLAGCWSGVRAGLGITVRTPLAIPANLATVLPSAGLPILNSIDIVFYYAQHRSAAVQAFQDLLIKMAKREFQAIASGRRSRSAVSR